MNVCLISREYPPFFGGGIGTYTVQWARTLAAAGHGALVVTVSDDGCVRREVTHGVTIVRLPFLKGSDWARPHPNIATPEVTAAFRSLPAVSAFAMQVQRALPDLVREFNIDIIEVPDTGALGWFGLNSRRAGGAWREMPPVVTTIHSPTAWIAHYNRCPLSRRPDHELGAMERDSAWWSDALISPSTALAEWAIRNWGLPREAIDIIPYPLGDLESAPAPAMRPRTDGPLRLLFIGRLEPRKGVDTLFESLNHLRGEVVIDLVGEDTPDPAGDGLFGRNSLESLVPQALRSRVRILGRRPPSELPSLRDAADAIVIPSPMDNFPYVCVESMAEGRLVIASSAGGTGEMIRNGVDGFLFDAGDARSCAEAISRAASAQGAWPEMRHSAAQRIRKYCGNREILDRRLEHYRRTKARSSSTPPADRALAVIAQGEVNDAALDRLSLAVRASGADFAHGWPRLGQDVFAFSTPTVRSLGMSVRTLGPLVATRESLELSGVSDLLRPGGSDSRYITESTWAVAMALCAAGRQGVCIPEAVSEVSPADLHPMDRDLLHQLDAIHDSRGWRALNRVYDVLHVVRGRGWRRPYHPRGRRAQG